jgi:predicted metal-dependent HD superfamily phosphohydrolase
MATPERWIGLWKRLGARSGPEAIFHTLAEHYSEPHRAYHTLAHVAKCLWEFDRLRDAAERPDEVEVALWLHDVVYDPRATDNEAQSAALATRLLLEGGVPTQVRERVATMIQATDHRAVPPPGDGALVVDIDLAILGAPADEFDEFERRIRREYDWVPGPAFRAGRRAVLTDFLEREQIYRTPALAGRYERPARENLARALERLDDD